MRALDSDLRCLGAYRAKNNSISPIGNDSYRSKHSHFRTLFLSRKNNKKKITTNQTHLIYAESNKDAQVCIRSSDRPMA